MRFRAWLVATPYPYIPLVAAVGVLVMGYPWQNALGAVALGAIIFLPLAWMQFRRTERDGRPFSTARSHALGVKEWPAEAVVRLGSVAVGVDVTRKGNGAHVLVFVPEAGGPWICAEEPRHARRGGIRTAEYPAFDSLVADFSRRGVEYLPSSRYVRSLAKDLGDRLLLRGVTAESIASGTFRTERRNTLVVAGGLSPDGPRLAEFRRRVPTRDEALEVIAQGLGLALHRVPKADRDLAFLDWVPGLTALWIDGRVDPSRIGRLTELSQLSLLETGDDVVDLTGLQRLRMYEGELSGRESILGLPLRDLYLSRVDAGQLLRVPETLQVLSLEQASSLTSLALFTASPALHDLAISGPRVLDIAAVADLPQLRRLTLTDAGSLVNAEALAEATRLRELVLTNVASIDSSDVLGRLRRKGVTIEQVP